MPIVHEDIGSVFCEATATATGDITVGAAVTGWQTFPAGADGRPVSYRMWLRSDPSEWEEGFGNYNHSTKVITRTNAGVTAGTAGKGTRTTFTSGSKHIQGVALARDLIGLEVAVSYSATIAWNIATARSARTTLTGDATVNATVNLPNGSHASYVFVQDGTGGHAVTFGTGFGVVSTPIKQAAGAITVVTFVVSGGVLVDPVPSVATASQDGLAPAALAATGILTDGNTFPPTAIPLDKSNEYDPYTQTATLAFALAAVTKVNGAYATVQFTGDGSAITWSADFAEIQGGDLTAGDYAGFTGSRRLVIYWSGAQGKALVALSGNVSGAWGSITGTLADQTDLQSALDAKAPSSSPTLSNATFTGTVTVPDSALAIADTSGLQAALDAKQPKAAFRTVTAAGNVTLTSADVGGTVELSAGAGEQVVQLPTLAGFSAGDEINFVCKLDDSLFANWPVMIEAATPGQMESQPQTAGWDTTLAQVQMGFASSKGARARALHASDRWLLTGAFDIPKPSLAPDQIADLEWWHDADQATLTLSTDDVTAWASKAGSIGGSFAQVSAAAAQQVGTPGGADYAVEFDMTAAAKHYEKAVTGQAVDDFTLFVAIQSAAGTISTDIHRHHASSTFGTEPHMWYGTISGRIQMFSPVSHGINFDTTGHASLPAAVVNVFDAPTTFGYLLRPTGIEARTSGPMDNTVLANSTHRIGHAATAARVYRLFTIARFGRALDAKEVESLLSYARERWGIP